MRLFDRGELGLLFLAAFQLALLSLRVALPSALVGFQCSE
jgi:hypothetical protein